MKDYFRPGSGLSLEPTRWGLGSGVRGARGPRLATCSARSGRDARGPVGGLTRGDSCRWDSRAFPSAQAMVAKQRIRMANEKHSKNITQRGNVAKTLVRWGRRRPGQAGQGRRGRGGAGGRAAGAGPGLPAPRPGPAPPAGSLVGGVDGGSSGGGRRSITEARGSLPRRELGLCLWEKRKVTSLRNS